MFSKIKIILKLMCQSLGFYPVRIKSAAYWRMMDFYPTNIHGFEFKCDPYHIAFPWKQVTQGTWSPDTLKSLSNLLKKESVFYDIGAWIGPITLLAARISQKVVSFEPDPIAFRFLLRNIQMNDLDNVQALPFGLAGSDGTRRMADIRKNNLGDSTTSLLVNEDKKKKYINVSCLRLSTACDIFELPIPDVIKIDIEGGEFELLPDLKDFLVRYKPAIHLSTHAPYLKEEDRKSNMSRLADVLAIYSHSYNDTGRSIDLDYLVSSECLNQFCSFVFMDNSLL